MSDQPSPSIDPSIAEYYHRAPEESRLEQGPFILEELRTRELIERHAQRPPATVLDVGGAAGAYALWLADAGYTVPLVARARVPDAHQCGATELRAGQPPVEEITPPLEPKPVRPHDGA